MTDPGDANGSQAVVAVGTVKSAKLPAPQLDVVETQTRAIGLIIPPHDIRVIIDKTADFVAKNGATDALTWGSSGEILRQDARSEL